MDRHAGVSLRPHVVAALINGSQMFFTPFGYLVTLSRAWRMASDAAITIAARSPILVQAAIFPTRNLDPEIPRMVSEKVAAMLEGAIGAQHEMAYLAASALRGESLPKLLRRTTAIGVAGLRPARRRIRANAQRLTAKGSKSGSSSAGM
jgi:hypothetical protein